MVLTDDEQKARTKRRVGCGFILAFLAVVLFVLMALAYFLFVRENPELPLAPYVPPESNAVVGLVLDLDDDGMRQILEVAADSLSLPSANRAQTLDRLAQGRRRFLHEKILVAARIDPVERDVAWVVVANIKRAHRLVPSFTARAMEDRIQWSEASGGEQRFQIRSGDIVGCLRKSQIFIANDSEWLEQSLAGGAQPDDGPRRALNSTAPICLAIDDSGGMLEKALIARLRRSGEPAWIESAEHWAELRKKWTDPLAVDLEFWPSAETSRLLATPRCATKTLPQEAIDVMAQNLEMALGIWFAEDFEIKADAKNNGVELIFPPPRTWLSE